MTRSDLEKLSQTIKSTNLDYDDVLQSVHSECWILPEAEEGKEEGSGKRTGMAYAFVDYDDRRDAEDAIKYENGREIKGQSIVVEWARGPSYRSRDSSSYPRNSNFRRDSYGRSSRQNSEECYRCRRTGHWARDCPDQDRDRYYPRSSRNRSRSRSRSRSYRNKSRSLDKNRRKPEKSKKKTRTPSKSVSRSRSPPSKSASRSPSFDHKDRSPPKSPENYNYEDKRESPEFEKNRSRSRSPRKSSSRSLSKEKTTREYDNESDSPTRSKSR
ncbi:Glycine-rich RNA-binding protein RZ1B like protein [Argiope bruennichi]|uniref:Glycine-rich RNA-binding protein RZ1B like protein n=1 Tax=Argiope bruennichi TaxID=94029 RepID=A0A8T0E7B2_ARGBR|nr:Glycine-rich RNA-binding protein RZ1B like protein [Argiope bruennichi]